MNLALAASSPGVNSSQPADAQKIMSAARQFEAILLNDLLGPLQKSFAALPGSSDSAGSGEYQYLGTQALATGLASAGGFGIADMIVRSLLKNNGVISSQGAKVSAPSADRDR
jgi:Rod binding domain-containing protein